MGERAVIYFAHDKAPVQLKHCFWWRKKKDELEKKVRKGEKRISKCKLHSRTPLTILFNGYFPGVQKSGGGPKVTSSSSSSSSCSSCSTSSTQQGVHEWRLGRRELMYGYSFHL